MPTCGQIIETQQTFTSSINLCGWFCITRANLSDVRSATRRQHQTDRQRWQWLFANCFDYQSLHWAICDVHCTLHSLDCLILGDCFSVPKKGSCSSSLMLEAQISAGILPHTSPQPARRHFFCLNFFRKLFATLLWNLSCRQLKAHPMLTMVDNQIFTPLKETFKNLTFSSIILTLSTPANMIFWTLF